MIDVNALKGAWVAKGYKQKDIAEMLKITPKTLCAKLKKGVLGSDEMDILVTELQISNPVEIFFKK